MSDVILFYNYNILKMFVRYFNEELEKKKILVHPIPVSNLIKEIECKASRERKVIINVRKKIHKGLPLFKKIVEMSHNFFEDTGYKFVLVGNFYHQCDQYCTKEILRKFFKKEKSVVEVLGGLNPVSLFELMNKSRIVLSTSISETFHLFIAESLANGCTLVGTPLNTYYLFSNGGKYGTVSEDFEPSKLFYALQGEVLLWEKGLRDPQYICKENRERFLPKSFASYISNQIFG